MGMAASQARYLSLTARKTNTEYQGQQVNQERTALANQSAGLFNQMLSLKVPTPPAATDYTKTYYTYSDPANTNTTTIDAIYIDEERTSQGNGSIYATIRITEKSSFVEANAVLFDTTAGGTNSVLECFEPDPNAESQNYTAKINGQGPYTITGPNRNKAMTDKFNAAAKEANSNTAYTDNSFYYQFTVPSTGVTYYIYAGEGTDDGSGNITAPSTTPTQIIQQAGGNGIYVLGTEGATKTKTDTDDVILNKADDGTGRYESITFLDDDGNPTTTFSLTQQTIQDDEAYDAAMATYTAEKAIYDKQVADINAETTVIQQQDKTLELHLDQLDTEQQAIQTEMDAVKKVIDKNIEETFKTFA